MQLNFTPLTPFTDLESLFEKYYDKEELPDEPILAAVINVLNHTNLLEALQVAETLKVNDRKLSAAMELLTGQSLAKFISEWRFFQSKQLLLNTELAYSEVANRCGYANETVLILQYERRMKTTPHIFRTGYRIANTNYTYNRHGYGNHVNGEDRKAKNKVYPKK